MTKDEREDEMMPFCVCGHRGDEHYPIGRGPEGHCHITECKCSEFEEVKSNDQG